MFGPLRPFVSGQVVYTKHELDDSEWSQKCISVAANIIRWRHSPLTYADPSISAWFSSFGGVRADGRSPEQHVGSRGHSGKLSACSHGRNMTSALQAIARTLGTRSPPPQTDELEVYQFLPSLFLRFSAVLPVCRSIKITSFIEDISNKEARVNSKSAFFYKKSKMYFVCSWALTPATRSKLI